jgi:hypothetical protein
MVHAADPFDDLLVQQTERSGDVAVREGATAGPDDFGDIRAEVFVEDLPRDV